MVFRDINVMFMTRSFNSKDVTNNSKELSFISIYKRQTLDDLASEYHRSISWIEKQIFEYEPSYKIHNPRSVNIVCDATFYGKRKDKLGTLVFKDSTTKEVLTWKHIQSETIKDYKYLLSELINLGFYNY